MSYNTTLQSNNTNLRAILDTINTLPEAGGVELPELSNPATAAEVFANKELIDADGNKIIGTFTIDNELIAQDDLISQLQATVDSLPEAGGGLNLANITVNGSYGTTFTYTGADGLSHGTVDTSTIQVVIPSICFIRSKDDMGFALYNISGGCYTIF